MSDAQQTNLNHALQRLRTEPIIWLGTVRPDGRPHLVPVWFLWEERGTVLIFSEPNKQKVLNIKGNPRVMLALNAIDEGEDVVRMEGTAELLSGGEVSPTDPAYAEKYASLLRRLGFTAEDMASSFTQAIRVTPTAAGIVGAQSSTPTSSL